MSAFLSDEVTAITRAPRLTAHGTSRLPTPPTGAQTSSVSPFLMGRISNNSIQAVRPFSITAAASSSLMPSGKGSRFAAGKVTCVAYVPDAT